MRTLTSLAITTLLFCGCASKLKQDDATRVATLASEQTLTRAHRLFADSYHVEGTVVKVEDHPANMLRSSMCFDVTYHVEYKQVLWTDTSMQPITNVYVLPITESYFTPEQKRFKLGDKVVINGWIEKGR